MFHFVFKVASIELFGNAKVGLVIPPPTDLGATLRWCPPNVFLACLDVGKVTGTQSNSDDRGHNHGVGRRVLQPDWFVLNVVNNLAARNCSAAGGDLACAESKREGERITVEQKDNMSEAEIKGTHDRQSIASSFSKSHGLPRDGAKRSSGSKESIHFSCIICSLSSGADAKSCI